jgi:beta-phosphoglucomutase-like phosphatase (HAD superfamily)
MIDGFDGVIFDCDGVLADSEPASVAAWMGAVTGFGLDVTEHEVGAFIGQTERDLAVHYAPRVGVSVDEMEAAARQRFLELTGGISGFDDAARAVTAVAAGGQPFGVGSNSPRWRLGAVLAAIGLASRIPVSVAGDEVARPKPAPDVYAEVASRIGIDPSHCVVIEDTPTGIRAARAAGCSVIAVHRGAVDIGALAEADRVVSSLDELLTGASGYGSEVVG